jgi:hypothetical protein
LHLLAEDKDQEFDGCRQDSEGAMWNSNAVVLPGTKGVYREPSMLWKTLAEGQHWKLIDEKAHQSTKGIGTSSVADYDTSRSAPLGFAPTIPLFENVQEYFGRYVKR